MRGTITDLHSGYTLIIIGSVLRECRVGSIYDYYNYAIAFSVFFRLSTYLLLVVVVWGVNSVLRDHLGNHPGFFKIIYGAILGVVGAIMVSYLGIQCYNLWLNTDDGQESDGDSLGFEQERIGVAYYALYLIAVVVSGALSMMAVVSLRSRRAGGVRDFPNYHSCFKLIVTQDLLGWIIALIFTMFIWTLFIVIELGAGLQNNFLGVNTYYAFEYIIDIFQSAAWIILLFIAKSAVFKAPVDNNDPQIYNQPTYPTTQQQPVYQQVPVPPQQQQYAYNNGNGTQQYYYQQQQQPAYGSPVQQNVQPKTY
jgi:hypothetical protein